MNNDIGLNTSLQTRSLQRLETGCGNMTFEHTIPSWYAWHSDSMKKKQKKKQSSRRTSVATCTKGAGVRTPNYRWTGRNDGRKSKTLAWVVFLPVSQ